MSHLEACYLDSAVVILLSNVLCYILKKKKCGWKIKFEYYFIASEHP